MSHRHGWVKGWNDVADDVVFPMYALRVVLSWLPPEFPQALSPTSFNVVVGAVVAYHVIRSEGFAVRANTTVKVVKWRACFKR